MHTDIIRDGLNIRTNHSVIPSTQSRYMYTSGQNSNTQFA